MIGRWGSLICGGPGNHGAPLVQLTLALQFYLCEQNLECPRPVSHLSPFSSFLSPLATSLPSTLVQRVFFSSTVSSDYNIPQASCNHYNIPISTPAKMRFLATVAAVATCLSTALAQVNIAFTSVPVAAVVGQPTNITWGGGDGVTVRKVPRGCEMLRSNS
jgi:hypothetical protein